MEDESNIKSLESSMEYLPNLCRFGHTITLINSTQAVLFGGAQSLDNLYNDCVLYEIKEQCWKPLKVYGNIPGERAAHAACCIEKGNLILFGGAKKNAGFASNDLYLLDLRDESNPIWSKFETNEDNPKPAQRYAHTLIYYKPYLVLFGGVIKNAFEENINNTDLWICQLEYEKMFENKKIKWELARMKNTELPLNLGRSYHTMGVIKSGKAKGMLLLFGGRNNEGQPLNSAYGLRKHRNDTWEWIDVPNRSNYNPIKRYQHCSIFYNAYVIILGGRNDDIDTYPNGLPVEIYDSGRLRWYSHFYYGKFRHASFNLDKYAFIHGGCDLTNFTGIPFGQIEIFDINALYNTISEYSNSLSINKKDVKNLKPKTLPTTIIEEDLSNRSKNSDLFNGNGIKRQLSIKPVIINQADLSCDTFTLS
ncbi:MAG: hypothetical protein MJ252_12590, partial [archaeon]|nr:hypothetical protein [archaeon]